MRPKLITLEGNEILHLSGEDINYLKNNYPEMLGVWSAIIKALAKIGAAATKGISGRVKRKRAERRAKAQQEAKQRWIEYNTIRIKAILDRKAIEESKKLNIDKQNKAIISMSIIAGIYILSKKVRKK